MTGSEIIIVAGKQLVALIAKKFGASIVERWSRHRAESFFAGFLQALSCELSTKIESTEVDRKLDEILGDEQRSDVLFDAYRSVCFSKSKTLGPKIIGLLTGMIVLARRTSDDDEDQVFRAAEVLSDSDLYDFFECYRRYSSDVGPNTDKKKPHFEHDDLIVPWYDESRDSAWSNDKEIDTSPLNMTAALGAWAARLEQVGVISSKLTQRRVEYREDSERHIDQDGVLDIYSYSLIFHSSAKLLSELFERVLGSSENSDEKRA